MNYFVSEMRSEILEVSIRGLRKEGLRFSVDSIAKELQISKKTVYKFFPRKEDLAIAVYERFYDDLDKESKQVISDGVDNFIDRIDLYYRSYCMIRGDLFNKYALNESIRHFALTKHNKIRENFENVLRSDDNAAAMFIIDSVFEKLDGAPLNASIVRMLERSI